MVSFTNCKINIGLDIVSRRPDGYHNIVTAMVPVPWHDVVEIVEADGSCNLLTVYGNAVNCPPEKNLVMKAAATMQKRFPAIPPLHIHLQKIIPDGAGLGGGSGDAATVILMLNDMFSLGIDKKQMAEIAAELGADCPFFIYSEPMLCTGTGTIMRPINIDLSDLTLLIAKPQTVSISTAQAYAGTHPSTPDTPLAQLLALPISEWQGKVKNDFEPSIFAIAPGVKATKDAMLASGAIYASMSGSGASLYALYATRAQAEAAKALFPTHATFLTEIKG